VKQEGALKYAKHKLRLDVVSGRLHIVKGDGKADEYDHTQGKYACALYSVFQLSLGEDCSCDFLCVNLQAKLLAWGHQFTKFDGVRTFKTQFCSLSFL